jgi:hypothetical protein
MTVRQRIKRRPVRIWASQYSYNTGCTYFLSPRSVGEVMMFYDYCGLEAWSKPK